MFRFAREQSVINVGGVKMGGQPGELPTVLCGTIFYHGHKIVRDEEKGLFDAARAEGLVLRQAELAEETGNPAVLHLFARTGQAFLRYLDFVEKVWNGPLIVDSSDALTRSSMARTATEIGYADRTIYNSISVALTSGEREALQDSDVDSAILLAYNPADGGVDGRIRLLEEGGAGLERGLLPLARDLGMTNLLLDPGVAPLGSGAGSALRFSVVAKARFGLPVGSGMHNAASSWGWLKGRGAAKKCCDAAASALQQLAAGDFVLYGPIENAETVFPVTAMADMMVAEAVRDLEVFPQPGHPIYRLA
ncbi:MAG: tetrahydromethanopterin S-methyltransferase subunit H [Methanosarcinales archaeon]|nr:tetrahydromethanopterin S-methyltransferase subunit H [Methanosarcinales archaeon]